FDQNLPDDGDRNDFCLSLDETAAHSCSDVLVKDGLGGPIKVESRATGGEQGNNHSLTPALSADGRYLAFVSAANNLVPGDTNEAIDVFIRDRQTGITTRVSVASDGTQANGPSLGESLAVSADGRYVAFGSEAGNLVADDDNDVCDDDGD